jgi:replicative DNA helicase
MEFTPDVTLLCAILTTDWQTGVEEAAVIVGPDDFLLDEHRKLWRAMAAVKEKGLPLSFNFVYEELEKEGVKHTAPLIAQIMDEIPLAGYVPVYAKRVKEAANRRRIAKLIELANTRIGEGEDEKWVKEELVAEINQVEIPRERCLRIGETSTGVMEAIRDRFMGDESKQGLKTGIRYLDEATTGINAGELWIVGGMAGRGKSAFALQAAVHLAEQGKPVWLGSLEMSRSQVIHRLLRMKFGADVMRNPFNHWERVLAYERDDLQILPLFVDDDLVAVEDVLNAARYAVQRTGAVLLIVDYLQLIKAKGRDRRESVSEASNALRILAKQTGVPVMALSQLRRPLSGNINDRPSMIDLKESGDIEAHAHVVLLLYSPEAESRVPTGEEEIIIGKQREGPTGSVAVHFKGSYGRFWERSTQ